MFRYLMLTLWIFLTALGAKAENQPDLIYYGWDSPDISQLLDIIPKLADSPFDGLGVFAQDHRNVFQTTPYPQVEYQNDLLRLSVIKRGALGRSFLVINTTTNDQFDWTNEAHWQATLANTKMIARMAKAGGFSGILFDMEPYGVNLWNTAPLAKKHPMAFAEMQILLERRGQSMMQAIETEFPNPQMFFLWGLSGEVDWVNSLSKLVSAEQSLSRAPTGLWPAPLPQAAL